MATSKNGEKESETKEGSARRRVSIPWPSYVRDAWELWTDMMETRWNRGQATVEQMAGGEYDSSDWAKEVAWWSVQWVRDGFRLCESFQRSAAGDTVPTSVVILDKRAKGTDEKRVPLAVRLQEGDEAISTPLTRIDEPNKPGVPANQIKVRRDAQGDLLHVSFPGINELQPGHYLGWVYLEKPGPKRPLAAIHLVKLTTPAESSTSASREA